MTFPNDFFEIDFLAVETAKSGDAITIRAAVNGYQTVNIVDGGFTDMGEVIVAHLEKYYDNQNHIDNVVLMDLQHQGRILKNKRSDRLCALQIMDPKSSSSAISACLPEFGFDLWSAALMKGSG